MTINEYIEKNLSSLNFNVLSQIFEENGAELTDEIKEYLKETPENTNWNVLSGIGGNGSESGGIELFTETVNIQNNDDGETSTADAYLAYIPQSIPSKITVILDDIRYENLPNHAQDSDTYGQYGGVYPFNDEYKFTVGFSIGQYQTVSLTMLDTEAGEHTITVYDCSQ